MMRAPGRESSLAPPLEESASGISRRSNPDQKEDPGRKENTPQDLRDAENEMPVGNLLESEGTEPLIIGKLRVPGPVNGGSSG